MRKPKYGRPAGVRNKHTYAHVCAYLFCKEGFVSHSPNSLFCSSNCKQNEYNLRKRIQFSRFLMCRVCGALLTLKAAPKHIERHQKEIYVNKDLRKTEIKFRRLKKGAKNNERKEVDIENKHE